MGGIYYNENSPKTAARLRNLIKAGLVPYGDVDDRSIEDVVPNDLMGYTQCHFFAGIGVWAYSFKLAGWPINKPVWSGSCPCQPFSQAGEGAGFDDERHLWPAWNHLIRVCKPGTIFGEQVAAKAGLRWLDLVQADLEAENYRVGPIDLCAAGVGADHVRQRLWWVADTSSSGREGSVHDYSLSSGERETFTQHSDPFAVARSALVNDFSGLLQRYGATVSLERGKLHDYGNAICPIVAKEVIEAYMSLDRPENGQGVDG